MGFEDHGDNNTERFQFVDHAMVFMARGVAKKWKQPIAYFLLMAE